ncbi:MULTISPECIES: STAS domain-containing protein [unclassified Streptomyces]|uniref:STAS domain-containing protein n=1 Tax=unclassified Streptomyces TaxID=2593676 RepID=UPI0029CA7530|nr:MULTISPECIES: STAS domain-containing protein [unclassified Streptomyces]
MKSGSEPAGSPYANHCLRPRHRTGRELDHDSAPGILGLLPGPAIEPGQQLVVDLGDSTGIPVLIAARNVALAAVPDRVSRIFSIVGLDQVFSTHATIQGAEVAWTPPAD